MVVNLIASAARKYFPVVMLPVAIVVGVAGYTIERKFRKQKVITRPKTVAEEREERMLKELAGEQSQKLQQPSVLEWQAGRGLTERERLRGDQSTE
ncbi:small integral membrane protein 12-A-like [Corticium candelabrum]|uniref:small integral membrane protein 12-A-like n=1 Tax=Corticium candelabrum TaxID=121492 RepID=UPI002E25AFE1|nr:small integral membrane protein 12-A-like [Corticium candelabrum]